MKPTHRFVLLAILLGVLYVITLGVGVRTDDVERPNGAESRDLDVAASFGWIGTLQSWFVPKMELEREVFELPFGRSTTVDLPASDARYRRLELEITEPAPLSGVGTVVLRYSPRTRSGEDYPAGLTRTSTWPEVVEDFPRVTFLILNGGGTLTIANQQVPGTLRVEVR